MRTAVLHSSLTACTPGSAPGPTLGIEYGKALRFTVLQSHLLFYNFYLY